MTPLARGSIQSKYLKDMLMKTIKKIRPAVRPTPEESFRVWIRPLGFSWKIHVEGRPQAGWLKDQLVAHNVPCTDTTRVWDGKAVGFRCLSETQRQKESVERLLRSLPQVRIQIDPA